MRQEVEDELLVIKSMYEQEFTQISQNTFSLKFEMEHQSYTIEFTLPSSYPEKSAPKYKIVDSHGFDFGQRAKDKLVETLQWTTGEICCFEWIENIKQVIEEEYGGIDEVIEESIQHIQQLNVKDSIDSIETEQLAVKSPSLLQWKEKIYTSEEILDRRSRFIAHATTVTEPDQVKLFINHLLQDKAIARATHNISAYRILMKKNNNEVWSMDCDDDGEDAAGGRLLHLLQLTNAKNVVVVVTRWFGGISLGPARFKHINRAARDALESGGFLSK